MSFTPTGARAPDFANAAFAAFTFAVRWHGRPFVAAYHGLAGAHGKQSGCVVPPNTTLLMILRSSASSNAWRRSDDLASAVLTVEYVLPRPFAFPRLSVMPWYPIDVALIMLSDLSPAIPRSSVDGMRSSTSMSCERRFDDRAAG